MRASWRNLLMINYEVGPEILQSYLPQGVELDLWQGRCLISLVGFFFHDLTFRGLRIPFHQRFAEVNLRFYVVRRVEGESRRGVVFIREVVPRYAVGVAAAARLLYHEKYVGCPMRSHVEHNSANGDASGVLSFAWRSPKGWLSIGSRYRGSSCLLQPGTEAHFVAQHYWGYGKRNDGRTLEYHVSHPTWSTWEAEDVFAKGPFAGFYGPEFGKVLSSEPSSAFVADGSDVEIDPPTLIS